MRLVRGGELDRAVERQQCEGRGEGDRAEQQPDGRIAAKDPRPPDRLQPAERDRGDDGEIGSSEDARIHSVSEEHQRGGRGHREVEPELPREDPPRLGRAVREGRREHGRDRQRVWKPAGDEAAREVAGRRSAGPGMERREGEQQDERGVGRKERPVGRKRP